MRADSYNSRQARGTVLILVVALLVILGLAATTFVLLTHADRTGSRALSRADRFEQVRQMALEHVRAVLLEDLVGLDGVFLNADSGDEPYDAPGDDPWLASHEHFADPDIPVERRWPFISKLAADSDHKYSGVPTSEADEDYFLANLLNPNDYLTRWNSTDTDGDGVRDARWIEDAGLPFAKLTTPDGRKYRVAIRIVDTNALANINVGMGNYFSDDVRKKWDGEFPAYLSLNSTQLVSVNPAADLLDSGVAGVLGRYGPFSAANSDDFLGSEADARTLYENLYKYLAYPALGSLRPFDTAEEVALRLLDRNKLDLHSRFTSLWPIVKADVQNNLPCWFTAYSWTMQIRPLVSAMTTSGVAGSEIEAQLAELGYPAPAKVPLTEELLTSEDARKAVYLVLLATGMTADQAAAFLVNLVDYIDSSNDTIEVIDPSDDTNSLIRFVNWNNEWNAAGVLTLGTNGIPSSGKKLYGLDDQPIISEVYNQRVYLATQDPGDGTWSYGTNPDTNLSLYVVELYNPTNRNINLDGWIVDIDGTVHSLTGITIGAQNLLTLTSRDMAITDGDGDMKNLGLGFTIGGGEQTITLQRPGPGGAFVAVDSFTGQFQDDHSDTSTYASEPSAVPVIDDFQRPSNRTVTVTDDLWRPTIAPFQEIPELNANPGAYSDPVSVPSLNNQGNGGQIILRNGPLHSLGELFYVPKVANDGTDAKVIEAIESDTSTDTGYRLNPSESDAQKITQYLTLRTGLYDGADNDGDGNVDDAAGVASNESVLREARVPGLININTAPGDVINALHYYYGQIDYGSLFSTVRQGPKPEFVRFSSLSNFAQFWRSAAATSSKDEDPDGDGVGSPDGIMVDNEQRLFHFTNVANLITVRSDVFLVYISIQASDQDGYFDENSRTLRTMAILDRSFCLQPSGTELGDIPLPRIVSQLTLP